MGQVTVAATQMACDWDRDANIARAEDLVRRALHASLGTRLGPPESDLAEGVGVPFEHGDERACVESSPAHRVEHTAEVWKLRSRRLEDLVR